MDDKKQKVLKMLEATPEWAAVDSGKAEQIFDELFEKYKNRYSEPTIVSFIKGKLRTVAETEDAEELTGFTLGGCDKAGMRLPVSYVLVKKDGTKEKVVSWRSSTIPAGPHITRIKANYNEQFNNYQVLELVDAKPVRDLSKIAAGALTIRDEGEFDNYLGAGHPVMVKGRIAWVNPIYNKDADGQRANAIPLLVDNKLVAEIVLEYDSLVTINLRVNPQAKGRPYIGLTDIGVLLDDAIEESDNPEEQAKFLQMGLKGRNILATGDVMNISERFTKEGDRTLPVYIAVGGITELESESTEPWTEPLLEAEKKKKAKPEEPKSEEPTHEPPKTEDKSLKASVVWELAEEIVEFCRTVNKTPTMLSSSELKKAGIGEGYTKTAIELGIQKAKSLYEIGVKQA